MSNLTFLKNKRGWSKYKSVYDLKFENWPGMNTDWPAPEEFPCYVISYTSTDHIGLTFRHEFIYKKDVRKLLN